MNVISKQLILLLKTAVAAVVLFSLTACSLETKLSKLSSKLFEEKHFKLNPSSGDITENSTIQINAENGTPPYTFEKVTGGGAITTNGLFTSSLTASATTIKGTDQTGKVAFAIFNAVNKPSIQPELKTLAVGNKFRFSVVGGKEPYNFRIIESGRGSVSTIGEYTAPSSPGTATLEVEDSLGGKDQATLFIVDALEISPSTTTIGPNTSQIFSTTGGVPPIKFSLESGNGSLNTSTGQYHSPGFAGTASVMAEDSVGNKSIAIISITNALQINPVSLELAVNSNFTFTATGGVPPYTYDLVSGTASINSSTGIYSAPSAIGTAEIRVTDSKGSTSISNVNINLALSFILPNIELLTNEAIDLSQEVVGGTPPITYSVSSGSGTVNSSTGAFTASNNPGTYTATVTDSQGHQAQAALIIQPQLKILPTTPEIMATTTLPFSASGGFPPYNFSVSPGGGDGTFTGTLFTAPSSAQIVTVRVTDSLGHLASTTVTVREQLEISPLNPTVTVNQTLTLMGAGGIPGYIFSLESGGGSITNSGIYTAPEVPGSAIARITDSQGNIKTITIRIVDALEFTPNIVSIKKSNSISLLATGGEPPYEFSILNGGGSLDETTGFFISSENAGTTSVQVRDSLGNTASGTIIIYDSVLISPYVTELVINENKTFSASGGQPPYSYNLVSGGGSIDSSSGIYSAPSTAGTAIVRVTDSLGQTSEANVTINPTLSIQPSSAQLAVNNSFQFNANGGVAPYIFTLQSGTGTTSSSGLYKAPLASGSAILLVTDADGRTSTANINISSALTITPSNQNLKYSDLVTFSASNGVPPYTFSVASGDGTINSSSGAYSAPTSQGTTIVRVTDLLNNIAEATITIAPPVEISPPTKSLAGNEVFTFLAINGLAPYSFSIISGGGTISSTTGQFTAPTVAGTTTIRVTDSLGQQANATITTYEPLMIVPQLSTIAINQSKILTTSGGVAPYAYSLLSGTGTFNDTTLTYSASSSSTTAKILVTDSLNNFDIATVNVVGAVTITPATATMTINETLNLSASGGSSPYNYSLVSGGGSVNASTGVFTAPASSGTTTVRVTDALGQTSDSTITVQPALSITPNSITLAVGNTQQFSASGGVGPYSFSLLSGTGNITTLGLYTSPSNAGSAVVRVTDADGRSADATITVNASLSISPTSLQTIFAGTNTFTASGGVGPYSFTVVVPGAGSIGVTTGAYTAPSMVGTETVRVTDALNNTADAAITIFGPVTISPITKTLVVNGTSVFTASGGKTPYTFSVSSGGGSINSSNGNLTASSVPGNYTVRVTDALGQYSDSTLTIESAIDLSPNSSSIKVGQSQLLSVSGGSPPLSYAVTSGSGSFNSGTMTYTATTSTTVAQVQVTDNLGYSDTVTINVTPEASTTLYFITNSQSVVAGNCSGVTEVGVQDTYGNITTADSTVTVNLTAPNISFFSDNLCTIPITSKSLATGASKISFYFKSDVATMDMITASALGYASANQIENITAGTLTDIRFAPPSLTTLAGSCSAITQLRATDSFGNPGTPLSTINVSLNGAGVTYYSDASCTSALANPTELTNGSPTKNLYVKKNITGITNITGTASGFAVGNLNLTVNPNVPFKLAYLIQPSSSALENVALTTQPKIGVFDEYDNFLNTMTTAITLSAATDSNCSSASSGTLNASINPLAATAGEAHFSGTSYSGTGTIYLKASASGLASACSNAVSVIADYSQSLTKIPAKVPSDGLAEPTLLIVPNKAGANLGPGKLIEVTSSSSSVTISCNGGACSPCQTPSATCVTAHDNGQGAYTISVKSSTVQSVTFTVRHNDSGTLNPIASLNTTFDSSTFTILNTNTTITNGNAGQSFYLTGGTITFNNTTMGQAFGDIFIRGANVTHTATTTSTVNKLDINVDSVTLQSGTITANGLGYTPGNPAYSYGPTGPSTTLVGSNFDAGGSHGGSGGTTSAAVQPGSIYGDYRDPNFPGTGNGWSAGGGVIRINATGTCTINSGATISANGAFSGGGSGSAGGSIKLSCAGFTGTAGTAAIIANGTSSQNTTTYGAGGGGRIALISSGNEASFAGNFAFPNDSTKMTNLLTRVQSRGGTNPASSAYNGAPGTIYLKHSGLTYGGLIVHNNNVTSPRATGLLSINATTGTVSGSNLPMGSSLPAGHTDIVKNLRLRPNITADNGTPTNLLDDNIVTITSHTLTTLTVSGSLAGVPSGVNMRSIEILDYLNVGGAATLTTGSDLVVLNGDFTTPAQLNFTNGDLILTGGASSYPVLNQKTLTLGSYSGSNANANNLIVNGATVNYSGTLTATSLTVNSGSFTANTVTATNVTLAGGTYSVINTNTSEDFTVTGGTGTTDNLTISRDFIMSGGTLNHRATTTATVNRMNMNVGNQFQLLGGTITANGLGYTPGNPVYSYGPTGPSTALTSSSYDAGGSHGGSGGVTSTAVQPGSVYGDYRDPNFPGTPGGISTAGGVIRINATGTCTINSGATISANGTFSGSGSGAAGGSIKLSCAGFTGTAGTGAISTNGSNSQNTTTYGAGGGGRIALISSGNEASFAGNFAFPNDSTKMTNLLTRVQSRGGTNPSNSAYSGAPGTIYLKHSGLTYGGLIVHNNSVTTSAVTPVLSTTANTSKINASIDANQIKVTAASTPFSSLVDIFKGATIHVWPTATGSEDPLSNTRTIAIITANAANTFVSAGQFGSLTIASNDHSYRIVNHLDALYVGGSATLDLKNSDLILTRSSGSLACDFTNASGTSFNVAAGSKIQGGNNYSSIDCPSGSMTTKGTTINFVKYCDGLGTCAP